MRVRRGDIVTFNTTGQCSCRTTSTIARALRAPTARRRGAAAERRGGRLDRPRRQRPPFGIGDQASVPMPGDGVLYLAVNDDQRSDNAGQFVVQLGSVR